MTGPIRAGMLRRRDKSGRRGRSTTRGLKDPTFSRGRRPGKTDSVGNAKKASIERRERHLAALLELAKKLGEQPDQLAVFLKEAKIPDKLMERRRVKHRIGSLEFETTVHVRPQDLDVYPEGRPFPADVLEHLRANGVPV